MKDEAIMSIAYVSLIVVFIGSIMEVWGAVVADLRMVVTGGLLQGIMVGLLLLLTYWSSGKKTKEKTD